MTSHQLLRVITGGSLSIFTMNLQTQDTIAPFPSWNEFGLRKENGTLLDRDSKFLFHYEEDPFDSNYEELQDFPTDEYENTEEESPYKTYTH